MSHPRIRTKPDVSIFMVSDQSDVQIAVSSITRPFFITEASDIDRSLIGTMVSELATNLVKYAGRGSIALCRVKCDDTIDVEIWAKDEGPGISNISLAMKDHYTTGNTLGLGLPSVRRLADEFSIQSQKDAGTVVYARKRIKGKKQDAGSLRTEEIKDSKHPDFDGRAIALWDAGFHGRTMPGELVSGDSATLVEFDHYILLSIIDVSGHGYKASELAKLISNQILSDASPNIGALMSQIHQRLIGTLGAAIGLLLIDTEGDTFNYIGVGNTTARRCAGQPWNALSRDGVLGQRLPTLYEQTGSLSNGDVFMMCTDGISEQASKGIDRKNIYLSADNIAYDLVSAFGKPHDDASCIIFKWLK